MEQSCLLHKSPIEKTMRAFCGGGGAASEFLSSSRSKQKRRSGSEIKHHNITISIFSSFSVSTQTQNGSQKLAQRGGKTVTGYQILLTFDLILLNSLVSKTQIVEKKKPSARNCVLGYRVMWAPTPAYVVLAWVACFCQFPDSLEKHYPQSHESI